MITSDVLSIVYMDLRIENGIETELKTVARYRKLFLRNLEKLTRNGLAGRGHLP